VDQTVTLAIISTDSVEHALQDIMQPAMGTASSHMYVIPLAPTVTLQTGCVKLVRTQPIMSIPTGVAQQNVLVGHSAQLVISKLVNALHVQLMLFSMVDCAPLMYIARRTAT